MRGIENIKHVFQIIFAPLFAVKKQKNERDKRKICLRQNRCNPQAQDNKPEGKERIPQIEIMLTPPPVGFYHAFSVAKRGEYGQHAAPKTVIKHKAHVPERCNAVECI